MANYDVTLDGDDYMILPNSYKSRPARSSRTPSQISGSPTIGRTRLTDFSVGVGHTRTTRAAANERGGLNTSTGAFPPPWPATMEAVGAHPLTTAVTTGFYNTSANRYGVAAASYYFEAASTRIYRWDRTASAPSQRSSALGADAVGCCNFGGILYIPLGSGTDVKKWDDSGAGTLTSSALGAGAKGYPSPVQTLANAALTYAEGVWIIANSGASQIKSYCDGAGTQVLTFYLNGQFLNWTNHDGGLIIATDSGLQQITGNWNGGGAGETFDINSYASPTVGQASTDDYAFLTSFQGQLYAWIGKTVVRFEESTRRWRHAGLEGSACQGAAVVKNVLYVVCSPPGDTATYQLWAFTGSGWWRIESSGTNVWQWPYSSGAGQLVTHTPSSATARYYNLESRHTGSTQYTPWTITTPALDAGYPDLDKEWRMVGFETLRNDGYTVGSWDFKVEYSTDGGQNWTNSGTESVTDETETISYAVAVTAKTIMLRATCTYSSGLSPHIIAAWAEYQLVDPNAAELENEPDRPREWQFTIPAANNIIDRTAAADTRTGQQIRAALWALWDAAATFAFRDLDYGATSTEHTVRLVDIEESWPAPYNQTALGADTQLTVTLRED